MAVTNPTPEETLALFKEIEQKFPSNLGADKWEILAVSMFYPPVPKAHSEAPC